MKTKHPAFMKLLILTVVIASVFGAINLGWYLGVKKTFDDCAEVMDKTWDESSGKYKYEKIVGDYKCIMGMPAYLTSGSSLTISKKETGYTAQIDADGNMTDNGVINISLAIYPKMFGKYTYRVSFYSFAFSAAVYIDSSCNIVTSEDGNTELDDYNAALISEHREEIDNLFKAAKELWDID